MFIRNGFVTNSSSTSFIFYGAEHSSKEYGALVDYLNSTVEEKDSYDVFNVEKVVSHLKKLYPNVGVHIDWETYNVIVYAKDSLLELEECGVDELPTDKLQPMLGKEEPWKFDLAKFEQDLKLEIKEPKWRIALSINR
jgi:hypothetical protein